MLNLILTKSEMDAMHTTLQTIATLLTSIAEGQAKLQAEATRNPQLQSAAEVSTPGVIPPLSLITPPLPPTTVETLSETALQNENDLNTAAANSGVQSALPAAVAGHTSKRSGIFDGLGKIFYLRS